MLVDLSEELKRAMLYLEEITTQMKTAFPTVIAKMEEMVKEITRCLDTHPLEKLLNALQDTLYHAYQVWLSRAPSNNSKSNLRSLPLSHTHTHTHTALQYSNLMSRELPDVIAEKLAHIRDTLFPENKASSL